jgi:integrase
MNTIVEIIDKYTQYRILSGRKRLINPGLKCFLQWIAKDYPNEPYLTQNMLDKWLVKRDSESAISYQSRYYQTVDFIRFARDRNYTSVMEPNPPLSAKSTYLPHIFTKDELTNFFRACDECESERYYKKSGLKHHNFMAKEAPIFYRLMYSTGMRPPEVRCLLRSDVNFETGVVHVHNTKGYNEHKIILHNSMLILLNKYNEDMNLILPNRTYMFPDEHDQPFSPKTQSTLFTRLWKKYNDTKCVSYCFRHNYAIMNINRLLKQGIEANSSLMALCRSMGHSSFQQTMHYYNLVPTFGKLLGELCDNDLNEILPSI